MLLARWGSTRERCRTGVRRERSAVERAADPESLTESERDELRRLRKENIECPTGEGKMFLAAVRDLFHRGIVGWDTSVRQDTVLVVSALTMALTRTGNPADVVHHVDKGSIYTSLDFAFAARNADMQLSFGSTGDAYDNAAMETFWARLKVEIGWIRGSIWFPT